MTDMVHQADPGLGALIPLREERGGIWADARLLHAALGSNTRFSDWITRRIADTLATEGEDFYSELSKTSEGGRPATLYMLSVDLAKEFAMLERNARGKAIRKYFIEAERRLREGVKELPPLPVMPALPTDPIELLELSLQGIRQTRQDVRALQVTTAALEQRLDNTPITMFPELEARIRDKCQELGRIIPGGYPAAYRTFKTHFALNGAPLAKYSSLPARLFDDAMLFLENLIVSYRGGRLLNESA